MLPSLLRMWDAAAWRHCSSFKHLRDPSSLVVAIEFFKDAR